MNQNSAWEMFAQHECEPLQYFVPVHPVCKGRLHASMSNTKRSCSSVDSDCTVGKIAAKQIRLFAAALYKLALTISTQSRQCHCTLQECHHNVVTISQAPDGVHLASSNKLILTFMA